MASNPKTNAVVIALVVLAIVLTIRGWQADQTLDLATQEVIPQTQTSQLINQVSRHVEIPEGTVPTVAKIVAVEILQAQNDFYMKAKNGDYLIIMPSKLILFDSQKDLIIDMAPLNRP